MLELQQSACAYRDLRAVPPSVACVAPPSACAACMNSVKTPKRAPCNSTKRAERLASWNAARAEGLKHGPSPVKGEDARFRWIDAVVASDLASTTRLVAHTLARNGKPNGMDIYPGIRALAEESRLSTTAVTEHIDILVRRGFLARESRYGETAGARGFVYKLLAPNAVKSR
jgi:hypothetical protein